MMFVTHYIFVEFYQFVKSEHKKEFDGVCKGITGEGCGYKPEDSISKKRVASALGKGTILNHYFDPSNAEVTFVQSTRIQSFLITILTLSCWYSLESSH